MSTVTNEYLLPLGIFEPLKPVQHDKTSCRFEFSALDYPWILISFIGILKILYRSLKCMGAIFTIGNSIQNYCH